MLDFNPVGRGAERMDVIVQLITQNLDEHMGPHPTTDSHLLNALNYANIKEPDGPLNVLHTALFFWSESL